MKIDLDILTRTYFWFDEPVPYHLSKDETLNIYPISVRDSEMFLSWIDILTVDKNTTTNPEYISMSYLEFITKVFLQNPDEKVYKPSIAKLVYICKLCLGWDGPINIKTNDKGKYILTHENIEISAKQFDDIKRIILYQNLYDYDDSYLNPDVKQAITDLEEMKKRNIEFPTLERRMAIVTSHTGLTKQQQLEMTYRSHSILFKEIYGEVDYLSVRTAVMVGNMFSKQKIEIEDWVYKKKHNKYENYFISQDSYNKSMGGTSAIHQTDIGSNDLVNISSLND